MPDQPGPDLGDVQETLYITLLARADDARSRRPLLRDPAAVEIVDALDPDRSRFGGFANWFTVLRTAIYDHWVREFLAAHPGGTVVELGSGLNARFERVDDGRVTWFDLDLPDTVEVRRRFFADGDRRHTIAASVLDGAWMDTVAAAPGPYCFVSEGLLVFLAPDDVRRTLRTIAERFPGAWLAIDTYSRAMMRQQVRVAANHDMARWQWACDDPRELESLGLRVRDSAGYHRPPPAMRRTMPLRYRTILPMIDRVIGGAVTLTLFETVTG